MSFILPIVTSAVVFGSTFDLSTYEFKPYEIYDQSVIPKYAQVTDISKFNAEFFLINTFTEFREVLGVDVATGLKALVDEFPYQFVKNYEFHRATGNDVKIVIKLSMRTMNESLPYTTPTVGGWRTRRRGPVGSHYVKSKVHGADVFILLSILGQNEEHANRIKQTVMSKFEKSGAFGFEFKEKLNAVLKEHGTRYTMSSFGVIPSHHLPLNDIEDALVLKDKFREIVLNSNAGKGAVVSYEMDSLSLVAPDLPSVQINREIIPILEKVELKYEDLIVANDDFLFWRSEGAGRLITDIPEEDAFYTSLENAKETMELAIRSVDISTAGSANQFDDAFEEYGDEGATKYRDWLKRIKQSAHP